ncbi:MAG: GNAT family N-acetyltransferase [Deltaproteobacteria bacterium]|nr:GNAT family N-acetyltransferase [Deltaproteobacteria bacterium]
MPGMHDTAVKIRRGKRTDLPALQTLLYPNVPDVPVAADTVHTRHWRRLASDPGLDFYVAEQEGAILGMLLVCYVRELRECGWQAIMDTVLPASASGLLGQNLLDFAKARARQRGCRRLLAWRRDTMDDHQVTALTQGGFHAVGDVLSCDL